MSLPLSCSLWLFPLGLNNYNLVLVKSFHKHVFGYPCLHERMHPTKVKVIAGMVETARLLPLRDQCLSSLAAASVGNALWEPALAASSCLAQSYITF